MAVAQTSVSDDERRSALRDLRDNCRCLSDSRSQQRRRLLELLETENCSGEQAARQLYDYLKTRPERLPEAINGITKLAGGLKECLDRYFDEYPQLAVRVSLKSDPYRLVYTRGSVAAVSPPRPDEERFWTTFVPPANPQLLVVYNTNQHWVSLANMDRLHFGDPKKEGWQQINCLVGAGELRAIARLIEHLGPLGIRVQLASHQIVEAGGVNYFDAVVMLGSELENHSLAFLSPPRSARSFHTKGRHVELAPTGSLVQRWTESGEDVGLVRKWRVRGDRTNVLWLGATSTFGVQALVDAFCGTDIKILTAAVGGIENLLDPGKNVDMLLDIDLTPKGLWNKNPWTGKPPDNPRVVKARDAIVQS